MIKSLIPEDKIIARLQFENPWWVHGQVQETYSKLSHRLYFDLFYPFVQETGINRAVILMGPRRVGKTVMLFHTIDQLLHDGIDQNKIFFIGIDNPIYMNLGLEDILALCQKAVSIKDLNGCYIFFDEIQYLKDWERHLKVLVDTYPSVRFVVSGSAAAALKLQSAESGAGRFTEFMLPPLTFQEYIHLKKLDHLVEKSHILFDDKKVPFVITQNMDQLNKAFINYLNFGGYPEVVFNEKIQGDMGRYVKEDIVDKVLLRDLPSLYGIKDVQDLNRFFAYLAYNTGHEFSFERISKESGINKETIKKYLDYLEAAFLIKVLNKVDMTAKHFKRVTSFKVYLSNPSLRTALFSPIAATDDMMGNMLETGLIAQWMHREKLDLKYARWKNGQQEGEVDLVLLDNRHYKPQWGVEIKWSNRYVTHIEELKSLKEFCSVNKLSAALVTSIDKLDNKMLGNIRLTFVPAALYAYNIGVVTMKQKNTWMQGDSEY